MSIIVLDSTTKSLKVNLSGAVANTNPSFVVTFADTTATAFTEASSDGVLNGTSNVTVVAAPAIATRRVIKNLIIKNNDTAAVTVNLFLDNNGTSRNIARVTLAVDDTWTLSGTFSSNGSLKQTLGTNNLDLTGTTSAQALTVSGATTLSAGTANGILYLNGSKVATSGSALTFDGTNLGLQSATNAYAGSRNGATFRANSANGFELILQSTNATAGTSAGFATAVTGNDIYFVNRLDGFYSWITGSGGNTERMRLDSSGNLGLGVTPSAWQSGYTVFQARNTSIFTSSTTDLNFGQNVYINSGGNYTYISNGYATLYNQYLGKHFWSTAPSGTAGNAITFTQAMTLDASGRLGVGTTSPGYKLDVSGVSASTTPTIATYTGGHSAAITSFSAYAGLQLIAYQSDSGSPYTKTSAIIANGDGTVPSQIQFWTKADGASSPSERARITSGGNLLVGATAASYGMRMRVDGGIASTGSVQFNIDGTAATDFEWVLRLGSGMRFFVNNASVMATLTSSGVWTNASDARYKENIRPVTYGLAEVMQLQPRAYNIIGSEKQEIGFVAQEVEPFIPELVESSRNSVTEEERLTLSYGQMSAVLVKAIQEQQALIAALTARIAALEGTQP